MGISNLTSSIRGVSGNENITNINKIETTNLVVTTATLGALANLESINATITNASIQKLKVLSASILEASIGTLKTGVYAPTNLTVVNASLTNASIQKFKVTNASINNASINKLKINSMIMNAATIADLGASSLVASYVNLTATRGIGGVGFRMNPDTKNVEFHKQRVSWKKAGVSTGWVRIDGYIEHPHNANHLIYPGTVNLVGTFFTINLGTFCATGARAIEIAVAMTNVNAGKSIIFRKHGGSGSKNVLQQKSQVGGVTFYVNGRVEVSATKAIDIFGTGGSTLWTAFIINVRGSYI